MNLIFTFVNNPGIGDNIRGLISLLQIIGKIKQKKDITFFVDFSKSKIHKYILHKLPTELLDATSDEVANFIYADEHCHDNVIIDFIMNSPSNTIRINTNNFPDINNINDEIKNYIKELLRFNLEFENELKKYFDLLPEKYHLYHYRFGDHVLLGNDTNHDEIKKFVESFKRVKKNETCVVISDSLLFKKYIYNVYKNNNVFVFLTKPTHTGHGSPESQNDINVFIDFMLITRAETINCYSSYRWISNFILWNSYIYNVPLYNLSSAM